MRAINLFILILSLVIFGVYGESRAQMAQPTMRDCSVASLSGSSQALLAGSSYGRKYLLIQNTGNANIGVNIAGGTAAIAGAGTITVVPGASLEYPKVGSGTSNLVPSNIINVIGTAAQSVTCIEGK